MATKMKNYGAPKGFPAAQESLEERINDRAFKKDPNLIGTAGSTYDETASLFNRPADAHDEVDPVMTIWI